MRETRICTQLNLDVNKVVALEAAASHHLASVLRAKVGEKIILFNGDGYDYLAVIQSLDKKNISVHVTSKTLNQTQSPLKMHLFQGICRGEKMDYVVQKATELGVAAITPIFSEYCNVKLDSKRLHKKIAHWQNIANSACEQSGRAQLVNIEMAQDFLTAVQIDSASTKLILHPSADAPLKQLSAVNNIALFVGPEGGFSAAEIKQAQDANCINTQLGPRILRSETAGLAAISICQFLWGDL